MFVGIDWAKDAHEVCTVDASGKVVERFTVEHSRAGFDELVRKLNRIARVDAVAVGIERPEGRLVDRILEAGHPIVLIPTFAMKALRRRYAVAGAKSDRGDSYVIADVVRTDGHRLRRLEPLSDRTKALRAVVRTRDDLVSQRLRLTNQLAATLDSFWPGAARLFRRLDSRVALAFLDRYPTPLSAARLGEARMASFLRGAGYTGRRSAAELLERLRSAPAGSVGVEADARGVCVRAMVHTLRSVVDSIKAVEREIVTRLGEHPDAVVFSSLPRSGQINAAQMLAEWGDCREAYASPDAVAMLAGVCPVTHASGKHRGVRFRWACNKRLRAAINTFAANSRFDSPWAARIYDEARARGCSHPHALRVLGRAWIRVIWRCWQDRVPYDPAKHGAGNERAVA